MNEGSDRTRRRFRVGPVVGVLTLVAVAVVVGSVVVGLDRRAHHAADRKRVAAADARSVATTYVNELQARARRGAVDAGSLTPPGVGYVSVSQPSPGARATVAFWSKKAYGGSYSSASVETACFRAVIDPSTDRPLEFDEIDCQQLPLLTTNTTISPPI